MGQERLKLPSDHGAAVLRSNLGKAVNIIGGAALEAITTDLLVIAVKSQDNADSEFELFRKSHSSVVNNSIVHSQNMYLNLN